MLSDGWSPGDGHSPNVRIESKMGHLEVQGRGLRAMGAGQPGLSQCEAAGTVAVQPASGHVPGTWLFTPAA